MLAITPTNVPINKDVTTTGVAGFLYSNPTCLENRDSFCTSKKMPIKTTDIIKYIREMLLYIKSSAIDSSLEGANPGFDTATPIDTKNENWKDLLKNELDRVFLSK